MGRKFVSVVFYASKENLTVSPGIQVGCLNLWYTSATVLGAGDLH